MSTTFCEFFIGLGSNLDQPQQQIQRAITALDQHPHTRVVTYSSLYGGKPLGPTDQPDYLNAVVQIKSTLPAIELLNHLQALEIAQHRKKQRHWGERTIDLDILLCGNQVLQSERLTIPHKELVNRRFVIDPLLEIAPQMKLPDGRFIRDLNPSFDGQLVKLGPIFTTAQ